MPAAVEEDEIRLKGEYAQDLPQEIVGNVGEIGFPEIVLDALVLRMIDIQGYRLRLFHGPFLYLFACREETARDRESVQERHIGEKPLLLEIPSCQSVKAGVDFNGVEHRVIERKISERSGDHGGSSRPHKRAGLEYLLRPGAHKQLTYGPGKYGVRVHGRNVFAPGLFRRQGAGRQHLLRQFRRHFRLKKRFGGGSGPGRDRIDAPGAGGSANTNAGE